VIATRALLALSLVAVPTHGGDELARADFDALFQKHGTATGIDWRLLKAVCEIESHLNPRAEHSGGLSAGLCQVHCAPAHSGTCRNRFNIAGWPPRSRAQLYDPDYNVSLAAQILAWNLNAYGLSRGVAVYNQWSARLTPAGRPLPNQFYVDQVLRRYRALQAEAVR
jgi:hypothetical protein